MAAPVSFDALPPAFKALINASQSMGATGPYGIETDRQVGAANHPGTWCSAERGYADTEFCSCVNAGAGAVPICSGDPCARSAIAYKPWSQYTQYLNPPDGKPRCPATNICETRLVVSGANNVVQGNTQASTCAGVVQTTVNTIQARPFLAALILIFLVAVVLLLLPDGDEPDAAAPAAPPAATWWVAPGERPAAPQPDRHWWDDDDDSGPGNHWWS